MSATEVLRRLLDERGVEWEAWNDCITVALPTTHFLEISTGTLTVAMVDLTPEQAIDATLGRGTCHDLAVTPDYRDKTEFRCSECGYEYSAVGGFGCDQGDEPDFRYCPNCGRRVEP